MISIGYYSNYTIVVVIITPVVSATILTVHSKAGLGEKRLAKSDI